MNIKETPQMKYRITSISLIILFVLTALLSLTASLTQASQEAMDTHAPETIYTLSHPLFQYNIDGYTSTLHLQNPNSTNANVMLEFDGDNGTITLNQVVSAYGTLTLPANEVTGLSNGLYSLAITSDQPVHTVINAMRSSSDKFTAYSGIHNDGTTMHQPTSPYTPTQYIQTFGLFFNDPVLRLQNLGSITTTVVVDFYYSSGYLIDSVTSTISPRGNWVLGSDTIPDGYFELAIVSSDQPVDGLLRTQLYSHDIVQNSLGSGSTHAYMPRVFKYVSNSPDTTLFVANTASIPITVTLKFYATNGTLGTTHIYTLSAHDSEYLDLDDLTLSDGIWSVSGTATGNFVLSEIFLNDFRPPYGFSTYGNSSPSYSRVLPHIARTDQSYTAFSIQNTGNSNASVTVDYYNISGTVVFSQETTIASDGWVRYDQSHQITVLGNHFEGSVIISSDQPIQSMVDEYYIDDTEDDTEYTLHHPLFQYNFYGYNSTLHLQNASGTNANVTLKFYGDNGTIILTKTVSAYGTLILPADEVTELVDGYYSLIITSDQLVYSVIKTTRSSSDMFAAYNGIHLGNTTIRQTAMPFPVMPGPATQTFGPYFDTSGLILQNVGTTAATVAINFYASDGTLIHSVVDTIPISDTFNLPPSTVPDAFAGLVRVQSDGFVDGLLYQTHIGSDSTYDHQTSLKLGGVQTYMPRVFKHVNEGDSLRSTLLFVANPTYRTTNVDLEFYAENGALEITRTYALPAYGSELLDLASDPMLPDGVWSVAGTATTDTDAAWYVALGEVSYYDSPPQTYGTSTYNVHDNSSPAYFRVLPHIAHTNYAYTTFNIQNTGSDGANIITTYYNISGTAVFNEATVVAPNGWVRYDQSQQATELGNNFEGSVIILSDQPIQAMADEYYVEAYYIYLPVIVKVTP